MITRDKTKIIIKLLDFFPVVGIIGPRQVGKTTTIHWLLSNIHSNNKLYLDLQNLANRELFETKNYDAILDEIKNKGTDTATDAVVAYL